MIIHYGKADRLLRCLSAVDDSGVEKAVVVDNSGNLQGPESSFGRDISIIRPPENLGFAAGVNEAAREITSPYFLILNPDTVVNRNAAEELTRVMDNEPATWISGPVLVDESGRIQSSGFKAPGPGSFITNVFRTGNRYTRPFRDLEKRKSPFDAGWLLGACLMVRNDRFKEMGGMDERFFLYGEDKDLCIRATLRGGRIRVVPAAVVVHAGDASETPEPVKISHFLESQILYIRKHYRGSGKFFASLGLFTDACVRTLVNVFHPARCIVYLRGAWRCLF